MIHILLVEDDYDQAESLESALSAHFAESTITKINTECEFNEKLGELEQNTPDIAVIDVMLRWTDPSPNMRDVPNEVKEGGHFEAGLRCERHLRELAETANVPVILYTVLRKEDMTDALKLTNPKITVFLDKDSNYNTLVNEITKLLPRY